MAVVDVDRIKSEAALTLAMLPFTLKPHTSRLQMNLSGAIIRADWHMREARRPHLQLSLHKNRRKYQSPACPCFGSCVLTPRRGQKAEKAAHVINTAEQIQMWSLSSH